MIFCENPAVEKTEKTYEIFHTLPIFLPLISTHFPSLLPKRKDCTIELLKDKEKTKFGL